MKHTIIAVTLFLIFCPLLQGAQPYGPEPIFYETLKTQNQEFDNFAAKLTAAFGKPITILSKGALGGNTYYGFDGQNKIVAWMSGDNLVMNYPDLNVNLIYNTATGDITALSTAGQRFMPSPPSSPTYRF